MTSRIRGYVERHHRDEWEVFKQRGPRVPVEFEKVLAASTRDRLSSTERADLGRIHANSGLPDVVRRAAWIVVEADDRA